MWLLQIARFIGLAVLSKRTRLIQLSATNLGSRTSWEGRFYLTLKLLSEFSSKAFHLCAKLWVAVWWYNRESLVSFYGWSEINKTKICHVISFIYMFGSNNYVLRGRHAFIFTIISFNGVYITSSYKNLDLIYPFLWKYWPLLLFYTIWAFISVEFGFHVTK